MRTSICTEERRACIAETITMNLATVGVVVGDQDRQRSMQRNIGHYSRTSMDTFQRHESIRLVLTSHCWQRWR
jgi:hypothetical protein